MFKSDKKLGMNRMITRRDIVHGIGALGASLVLPGALTGCDEAPMHSTGESEGAWDYYPPSLTGMRGNHDGAFDVAHALGREGQTNWGPVQEPDPRIYDLVIVGGGISGLSAAHFYSKNHPDAHILILDNHDDFGGHAKRNEFEVEGRKLIGYGGSQTLQDPSAYNDVVKGLLRDLGVNLNRFNSAYDQDFYKRHGLKGGLHFNKEKWGVDRIVPLSFTLFENYIPLAKTSLSMEEIVDQVPISDAAKNELLYFLTIDEDQIPHIPHDKKWDYLQTISYREFLMKHAGVTEAEVFEVFQDLGCDDGVGIEAMPASSAISEAGLPGWDVAGLSDEDEASDPYIHHFPDGNASIARLLVRSLIPDVAPGHSMDDIVTAPFDYAKLDQANSPVRIRLNSTVTNVEHEGDLSSAETVWVSYVLNGQAYRIQARGCILACNNSMIPYLCPELSDDQQEALSFQVKVPILYTSVAVRNWHAWKKLGYGSVYSPGSYHVHTSLDFPVSLGDYSFSNDPDEPVLVHMERFPHVNNQGYTNGEQYRLARHELLSTPFETIERNVRNQLGSILGEGGFDPAEDILGITVNRWAHGYARWYNPLFDKTYDSWNDHRYPHMQARKPLGRITIANSDSGASAMLESAVTQAHRAVTELLSI